MEPRCFAAVAADLVRQADAHESAVGDESNLFQLRHGMVHQSEVYVTGPEKECSGMRNRERVPGAVLLTGSHASQTELSSEVEKMFRKTKLYCVQGCARAVKGMMKKIEAAVEVASEEDSAAYNQRYEWPEATLETVTIGTYSFVMLRNRAVIIGVGGRSRRR